MHRPSFQPAGSSALLSRLLHNDRQAWEELIERFSPLLVAIASRTLAHYGPPARAEDAEDAVAEVWKNLLEDDLRIVRNCLAKDNFLQTIHVLARHRSIDLLRRRHACRVLPLTFDAPAQDSDVGECFASTELVEHATQVLEQRERTLVELFFLHGKKYREIAQLTGIPQNSIGPTLARAMAKMRKVLLADAR